jgi:hypothetical protein
LSNIWFQDLDDRSYSRVSVLFFMLRLYLYFCCLCINIYRPFIHELSYFKIVYIAGADPGFQVRGGAHLKKLRRAEEGAKMSGVFRVKNHDFTTK